MSQDRVRELVEKRQSGTITKGESAEVWVRVVGGILAGVLLIVICGLIFYACASAM